MSDAEMQAILEMDVNEESFEDTLKELDSLLDNDISTFLNSAPEEKKFKSFNTKMQPQGQCNLIDYVADSRNRQLHIQEAMGFAGKLLQANTFTN